MQSLQIAPAESSRRHMRIAVAICLAVLCLTGALFAQTARVPIKPGRIYVGSFGMGDDAEHLKLALAYELGRAGFKVADFEQQADSILTGLIVTRVEGGRPLKRVTVFLKDKAGKPVWNEDIGSTSSASRSDQDAIRQRAQDIATALKKDSAASKASPAAKSSQKK